MAKTDKVCIVCGIGFLGTAKAGVCGATCRKKLQRLKAAGKKPEFALIGGKNTKIKIQDLNKPTKVTPITEPSSTTTYTINTKTKKEIDYSKCPERKKDVRGWNKWMR